MTPKIKIIRLNSGISPIIPEERNILAALNPEIIELESATDDEIAAVAKDCDALIVVSPYVRTAVVKQLVHCPDHCPDGYRL